MCACLSLPSFLARLTVWTSKQRSEFRQYTVLICSSLPPIFFYRGILAVAWSMADPELLLSCGKDAKILCSNPNTGEVGGGVLLSLSALGISYFYLNKNFPHGY
jgi:hypothetical protein